MSDHVIMWTEFDVDKTDVYLRSLARQEGIKAPKATRTGAKKKLQKRKRRQNGKATAKENGLKILSFTEIVRSP